MGGGGGKGGTTVQATQIPPEVLARYNAVNARAEEVAKQPFQQYGGEFVAPLNERQLAGMKTIMAGADMAQPYYTKAGQMTEAGSQAVGPLTKEQIDYYRDPAMLAMVDPVKATLAQQSGQQLAQQQAAAIRGGAFGGDRAGIERAALRGQQQLALGQALSPIYQRAYETALGTATGQQAVKASDMQRLLAAGQQYGGIGTAAQQAALAGGQAQIGAGTLEQQTRQALNTAKYQEFLQERGYPFQVAQFLANIATGTGALSGSTTTTNQSGGFFSDERLKHNIEPIGKTYDGQDIYRYDMGDGRTQIGLMAQEVLDRRPTAVGERDGYLTVDYRDATDDAASIGSGLVPQSMGGAVHTPGMFARGGYAYGGYPDFSAILQANQAMFGGLGGQKAPGLGIPSERPSGSKQMLQPHTPPSRQRGPNPFEEAGKTAKGIEQTYEGIDKLKKFLTPSNTADPKFRGRVDDGGAGSGMKPTAGEGANLPAANAKPAGGGDFQPNTPQGFFVPGGMNATPPVSNEPLTVPVDEYATDQLANAGDWSFGFAEGGLVPSRKKFAGQGFVTPGYDPEQNPADIMDQVVDEGEQSASQLLSQQKGLAGQGGGGGGGGGGSALGTIAAAGSIASTAAKFLPMIFASDRRLKDNIEPIGQTYDGQNIYRYDFGDGRTRIGLMAQEVLDRKPDAVYQNEEGYLGLDYDRATRDAVPFAYGGLVPRESHRDGEEVGNQPKVDVPAPSEEPKRGFGVDTLVDKITPSGVNAPENFWVPALSFVGGMLTSPNRTLAGAVGSGLLSGVQGYSELSKHQANVAKNVIDVFKDRYVETIDPYTKQPVLHNTMTGQNYQPGEVHAAMAKALRAAGVNPEKYGVIAPAAAKTTEGQRGSERQDRIMPGTVTGGGETPRLPAPSPTEGTVVAQPKPGEEVAAPGAKPAATTQQEPPAEMDPSQMNRTQLRFDVLRNPQRYGLGNDVARLQAEIKEDRDTAAAWARLPTGKEQALKYETQAKEREAKLEAYIKDAIDRQDALNKKTDELRATSSAEYGKGVTKRISEYERQNRRIMDLNSIYNDFESGRSTEAVAALKSWISGIPGADKIDWLQKGRGSFDAAMKLAMSEAVDSLAAADMQRAPASGLKTLIQTVPSPTLDPAATYSILGRMLGELEWIHKKDMSYQEGMSPLRFEQDYYRKNPGSLKDDIATGLSKLRVHKNVPPDQLKRLMEDYGYTPPGAKEVGAKAEAPAVAPGRTVGEEKQFKQGVGVWDGSKWVPKGQQ